MAAIQASVGNRGMGAMLQRDPATAPAQQGPAPVPPTSAATYVIWDRHAKQELRVDAAQAKQEYENLKRLVRYLAREIPADAARVLEEYPYERPKEMYATCTDALQSAARALARGDLVNAGVWASAARRFSDIEVEAHKIFQQESVWSYVGKRVGLGVIGFFQGAADVALGIVDSAAGLFGADTGLVKWNERQYDTIKGAYGGAAGIEHQYVNADEIGRFGGKVAGGLATGKALQGAGTAGQIIMGVQAVTGVKGAVDTIMALRAKGASWADIATDPIALSQVAGAIAGVAGIGSIRSGELKQLFDQVGLYASGAQFSALTAAIIGVEMDASLSDAARFQKRLDLLADAIVVAGSTADTVHGPAFEGRGGGRGGEGGGPSGGGPSGGGHGGQGGSDGVPQHIGPDGDAHLSPDVSTGVPQHIGPDGDARLSPDVSTGVPQHIGPDGGPLTVDPHGTTEPHVVDARAPTEPQLVPVDPHQDSFPRPVETDPVVEVRPGSSTVAGDESVAGANRADGPEHQGADLEAMRREVIESLARYQELQALEARDPTDPAAAGIFDAYDAFQRSYADWLSAQGLKPYQQIRPGGESTSFPDTAPPIEPAPTQTPNAPDPRAAERAAANEAANALLDQLRAVQEGRRAAPDDPILQTEEQRLLGEFYGAYADMIRANGIDPATGISPGATLTPR
jgi:hypothetical protein